MGLRIRITDTDFDTLPDAWEIAQGRNPLLADYQISTGTESSCALTDKGIVCWGKDNGSLNVPESLQPNGRSRWQHLCLCFRELRRDLLGQQSRKLDR